MSAFFVGAVTLVGVATAPSRPHASITRARSHVPAGQATRLSPRKLGGRTGFLSHRAVPVSVSGRGVGGRARVASRAASAAGNRPNASEERTASDEDNVVVEGVVMPDEDDDDGDADSQNPTGHGEESPSALAVDEETEKAFRAQVATAFDAVAMDANFQDDLRRRSEESEAEGDDRGVNRGSRPIAHTPAPTSRATLWWRAIKLPMYSVALAPLAVAGALCHHWYGCVNVPQWGALTAGACLIIAW